MWYFSWILGLGLACAFAVLNAIWLEVTDDARPLQAVKFDDAKSRRQPG
jgi:cyd operon protein YbgT